MQISIHWSLFKSNFTRGYTTLLSPGQYTTLLSPMQIKKNGACAGDEKPAQIYSCVGWYRLPKILNSSSRIYFNWYNRINFKLILLTLLFKSLFFKTNLNCSYFLLLDIFSIVTQWGFCKYVLSKKIKTDIVNKSAFRNRKLIVNV